MDKALPANPLLPVWGEHSQFTRIDLEDLYYSHIFIGDVFAKEVALRLQNQKPQIQNPDIPIQKTTNSQQQTIDARGGIYELFPALYTTASLDRRSTLMKQLRESFVQLFGQSLWQTYVEAWEADPTQSPNLAGFTGGRRKKRRRKKTKRRRKKKRKTRRKKRKKAH